VRVALISPYQLTTKVPRTGFHMVLAPLLESPTYRPLVAWMQGHKILDNGAAEGSLVERPQKLVDLARAANCNELVVPDVLGDVDSTISRARDFERVALRNPDITYMGVVQGKNLAEYQKCLNAYDALSWVKTVALPRHMLNVHKLSRVSFLEIMVKFGYMDRFPDVHCLGSGAWTREVACLSDMPVRSIDTAMPIKLGLQGKSLAREIEPYSQTVNGGEYFEFDFPGCERDNPRDLCIDNCWTFIEWAGAKASSGPM
jgi:hypothetical protein